MKMDSSTYQKYLKDTSALKSKDCKEIDVLISPSRWCLRLPGEEAVTAFDYETQRLSDESASEFHIDNDIPYGDTEKQRFDILSRTKDYKNCPLFIFFHGGYWMAMKKEQFYHIGKPLVKSGIVFITVGYDLAPGATMTEIVKQCSKAIEKIISIAEERHCRDIYIAGHSAGGQLALMSTCWMRSLNEVSHYIKGFILMSGVFDLHPLQLSSENKVLQITDVEAEKYSPLSKGCIDNIRTFLKHSRYLIIVPEHDAPEFLRQAKCLHEVLLEYKINAELVDLKGRDHFDYIEKLAEHNDLSLKIINFINTSRST